MLLAKVIMSPVGWKLRQFSMYRFGRLTSQLMREQARRQQPKQSPNKDCSSTLNILVVWSSAFLERRLPVMLQYAKLSGSCDVENLGSAEGKGKCLISEIH